MRNDDGKSFLQNRFGKGMNLDLSDYIPFEDGYTHLSNGTFLTNDENELILQNEKGTIKVSGLKEGYIPVAVKSYNSVAYILSAEVEYLTTTDYGSILYEAEDVEHRFAIPVTGLYELSVYNDTDHPIVIHIQSIHGYVYGTVEYFILYPSGSLNSPAGTHVFLKSFIEGDYRIVNTSGLKYRLVVREAYVRKRIHRFTGRGEIGSYPSPDYEHYELDGDDKVGMMIDKYQPFQNYGGDGDMPIMSLPVPVEHGYGDFNSRHFDFREDSLVKIVALQEAYDGSVNVLFTDYYHKPRIINARFTVEGGNRYRIVNRKGQHDENLYKEADWGGSINQILKSSQLIAVSFLGQEQNGSLPNGVYRYYFKYVTPDGNMTDVVGYSFDIPVFFGNSVATTRGGVPNEKTDKANILLLENLDLSFKKVRVYFSYLSGNEGGLMVDKVYELMVDYDITGYTLTIIHTGNENVSEVSKDDIRRVYQDIDTYKTGVELRGRLFIANIRTRLRNFSYLASFARKITLRYVDCSIDVPGLGRHLDPIFQPIAYNTFIDDGYAGGYYNPRNVHDRLGYFGGETYAFAVSFIFEDGSETDLFPVRGHDDYHGNAIYTMASTDNYLPSGENVLGIYRFPRKTMLTWSNNPSIETQNTARIYGIRFHVPRLDVDLAPLKANGVIGMRFYRTAHKFNLIVQGLLIDTVPVPNLRNKPPQTNATQEMIPPGHVHNSSTCKLVPAYAMMLETPRSTSVGSGGYNHLRPQTGIEPVYFDPRDWHGVGYSNLGWWIDKKFALIAGDMTINPVQSNASFLSSGTFVLQEVSRVWSRYYCNNGWTHNGLLMPGDALPLYPSVIYQVCDETLQGQVRNCQIDLVYAFNSVQTIGKFSAACDFIARSRYSPSFSDFGDFRLRFNTYLGVTIQDNTYPILTPPILSSLRTEATDAFLSFTRFSFYDPTSSAGVYGTSIDYRNTKTPYSHLVNIYPAEGLFTTERIFSLYNVNNEVYFPISQPYYLDEQTRNEKTNYATSNFIDSISSNTIFFNGDCYLNLVFHRLFLNALDKFTDYGNTGDDNIIQRRDVHVGYTLAFLCECKYNMAAKREGVLAVNIPELSTYNPLNASDTFSNRLGANNPFRINRQRQSEFYNAAHAPQLPLKLYTTAKEESYYNTFLTTRIAYSDEYYSNNPRNGYRVFQPLAYKDYPKTYGQIIALEVLGNDLLVVFENGIAVVPVNERVATQGDGQLFFSSLEVLQDPKYLLMVSDTLGTTYMNSVCKSPTGVYGVDIEKAKVWKVSGRGLSIISDLTVQSWIRKIRPFFTKQEPLQYRRDIRTFYDPHKQRVVFSFRSSEDLMIEVELPPRCNSISYSPSTLTIWDDGNPGIVSYPVAEFSNCKETIIWSDQESKWLGFYSEPATIYFNIYDQVYGFPLIEEIESIYQHYVGEYQHVYGRDIDFVLEVRVTYQLQHAFYENLLLQSNHVYPYKIEYETEDRVFVQYVKPRNKYEDGFMQQPIHPIPLYDSVYKEGIMYITVSPNQSDTRTWIEYINTRVRGKYCKIRLYYRTNEHFYLSSMFTAISLSYV